MAEFSDYITKRWRFILSRRHKWLYNSLGLTYTSEVNAHVHHLTRAGVPDDCPTCAVRANSSAHVHSWKKIFNRTHLDEIKEVCGSYMKDLGYT